jgi:hypothetical protein
MEVTVITPLNLASQAFTPKVLCIAGEAEELSAKILIASTITVHCVEAGLSLLGNQDFDVVLVMLPLADCACPIRLLAELQQAQPGTPIVL